MPYDYTPAGSLITDEILEFGGSDGTYTYAYLSNITNAAIGDADNSNAGVYTLTSKGGTKKTVLFEGIPSTDEILINTLTGECKILATETQTLYIIYYGFGEFDRSPKFHLYINKLMDAGETKDHWISGVAFNGSFRYFQYMIDGTYPSSAAVTLQLRDAISGAGNTRDLSLGTVSASNLSNSKTRLATDFYFDTSKKFVIRGDGKDISGLHLWFW